MTQIQAQKKNKLEVNEEIFKLQQTPTLLTLIKYLFLDLRMSYKNRSRLRSSTSLLAITERIMKERRAPTL